MNEPSGSTPAGRLLVVATPIGNLDDLSPRARAALAAADAIACEDTRRTGRLLQRFDITVPLISCHKFNERERLESLIERMRRGQRLALVSDGGTPAISDPGSLLVDAALAAGIAVEALPGPSAVVALLSCSGFPADRFVFDGFLPHRGGERRRRLRELATERRTVVVYEAPHRIRETLEDCAALLPDRPIALGRELTKLHEQVLRGDAPALLDALGPTPKGEIVLAIRGATGALPATSEQDQRVVEAYRSALEAAEQDGRQALRQAARELGLTRPALRRKLVELGQLD